MKGNNTNILYYLTTIGLFILLKFCYTLADNNNLRFLLKPTDKLVELLTNSKADYFSDKGYYHEKLNIIIEKSCSGFNFWLLCFCMLTFLALKYFDKSLYKALTIPVSMAAAYILTIFVNGSRIFASIILQTQAKNFFPNRPHLLLHETLE